SPVAGGSALVAFHAWIVQGPGVGAGGACARRHARGPGSRWHHLRRAVRRRQRGERLLRARPQRLRSSGRAVWPLWGTDHSRVLHEPFLVQLSTLSTCPWPLNPGTFPAEDAPRLAVVFRVDGGATRGSGHSGEENVTNR